MKEGTPAAANGEGSSFHLGDDDESPSTTPTSAQIVALPRYPRRRIGVRQVEGGWRAMILLADGRPSPCFKASRTYRLREHAILAAKRAGETWGFPVDLHGSDDDGPIAA